MTSILGISAFYHDSAAALIVDGRIVAAAQEERFSRRKQDSEFPRQAVDYCLREAGIQPSELNYVAFYEKPMLKFDRLLETYFAFAPAGFSSFRQAMPLWLRDKIFMRRMLRGELAGAKNARFVFTEHHESHAASAFFPSPFDDAAILTIDGVGEWSTATMGTGDGNRIELLRELKFPHSLGLLYSAFTYYCGFKVNSGEYKLMGLAPYGLPKFADAIREHLLDLQPDGSFRMNMEYFNYCQGLTMTNRRFHELFGGPPRSPESQLEQRHMDLAASIQVVTEEIVLSMTRELHRLTQKKNLVLAGGVALNCVANGRLLREGPFSQVWIQPAAGDAGGALGAALFTWHQLLEKPRQASPNDSQSGSFLGPRFSEKEIEKTLAARGISSSRIRSTRRRKSGRLVSGKDGIWPACSWRAKHPRRCQKSRNAIGDERQNKISRELSAVCSVRFTRACIGLFRASTRDRKPIHAAGGSHSRTASPTSFRRGTSHDEPRSRSSAQSEYPSFQCARGHSRRLQRTHSDRGRRTAWPALPAIENVRQTHRLPNAGEHKFQRSR